MIQKVNLPDSISGYFRLLSLVVGFVFIFFLFSLTTGDEIDVPESNPGSVEFLRVRVLAEYPHDLRAFTQGLLWHNGSLNSMRTARGHAISSSSLCQPQSSNAAATTPVEIFTMATPPDPLPDVLPTAP